MSQPNRILVWMLGFLVLIGLAAAMLFQPLQQAFGATPLFNGVILAVFAVGIFVNLRHVLRLQREVQWIEALKRSNPDTRLEHPVLLAPMALLTTHTRAAMGVVRAERRSDLDAVAVEIAAVARAAGAQVDLDTVHAMFDRVPPDFKSSMQRDAEAGRPTELDAIGGAVLRAAQRYGIATPVTARASTSGCSAPGCSSGCGWRRSSRRSATGSASSPPWCSPPTSARAAAASRWAS